MEPHGGRVTRTPPLVIGVFAVGTSIVGATAFALNPGEFDQAAALVVLFGVVVAATTGLVGLVLVRAPWGRWTLLTTLVVVLLLDSTVDTWVFWVMLIAGGVAAIGLLGPWLTYWIRRDVVADAPGPVVVTLIAIGPGAPLFVGIVALKGLHPSHVLLIAVTMVSSWAYGRGIRGGLWGLRLVFPVVGLAAITVTDGIGQIFIGLAVAAVTILAWMPHARRATAVITPRLARPIKRTTRSDSDASD